MTDPSPVHRERDLLERLLDLAQETDTDAFLREALAVAVARSGALRGYLALFREGVPRWSATVECSDEQVREIEASVSTGIIARALATGEVLRITNAMLDPNWRHRESVQRFAVEAVVCCPIGEAPPIGVLYLQGHPGGGPFPEEEARRAARLAGWLTPLALRHLAGLLGDPTEALRAELRVDELVGRSDAMVQLLKAIGLAARYDIDTLLTGPTGAGKTAVARAIARNGSREKKPFVEINCAALASGVAEAQLFGAAPGSYTGAPRDGMPGLIPAAEGGILFFDEVGELTPAAQGALLQFLDEGKRYRRLGETALHAADVRVIAATHRNLQADITSGRFRSDLYHRLCTLEVRVPGLDERLDDLPLIAAALIKERAARHGLPPRPLSPAALRALLHTEWTGHIRELGKALERGLIFANEAGSPTIAPVHLFPDAAVEPAALTWAQANRQFQASFLQQVYDECDHNVPAIAERLDLSVSHVYALLSSLGVRR